jgi:methylated-DNA-protein-cysteine methyltransferase related protein
MPYDPARHGPQRLVGPGFHGRVHELVRTIPVGRVATYGSIAAGLGSPRIARQVGFALASLPAGEPIPWWRVVGAGGRLTTGATTARTQTKLLRHEGVTIRVGRVVDFAARHWRPPTAAP